MGIAIKFAKSHEWIRPEDSGASATIGISSYAVEAATDLVFMQLPQIGRHVKAGESIGEIESVKAVSDLYAPVSGEIVEVNASLRTILKYSDPILSAAGWVLKIRMSNPEELDVLLDQTAYDNLVSGQGH